MPSPRSESLDDLFARLQSAADAEEAQQLEYSIWEIWCHFDDGNEHINHLMDRAALMMGQQRFEHALVLCNTVIELASEFAEGWNRRATVRYLAGDIVGSIADIESTLELEPRHFGALSGLGLCFLAMDELERAADTLRRTLKDPPLCIRREAKSYGYRSRAAAQGDFLKCRIFRNQEEQDDERQTPSLYRRRKGRR